MTEAGVTQRIADTFRILGALDRAGLYLRDALVIRAMQTHPGSNGNEISEIIGMPGRSSLQHSFRRLQSKELVEDRRVREGRACPSIYHLTEKGNAFMQSLLGPMEN